MWFHRSVAATTQECPEGGGGGRGCRGRGREGREEGCGEIDEELAGIIRRREREGDVVESWWKEEGKGRLLGKAAPDKT